MKIGNLMYQSLSVFNDFRALFKGRILQRIWNKIVLKFAMKFIK